MVTFFLNLPNRISAWNQIIAKIGWHCMSVWEYRHKILTKSMEHEMLGNGTSQQDMEHIWSVCEGQFTIYICKVSQPQLSLLHFNSKTQCKILTVNEFVCLIRTTHGEGRPGGIIHYHNQVEEAVREKHRCFKLWKAGGRRAAYNTAKRTSNRVVHQHLAYILSPQTGNCCF